MKTKKKKQIKDIRDVLAMLIQELREQAIIDYPFRSDLLKILYGKDCDKK